MKNLLTNFYLKSVVLIIAFIGSVLAWISWGVVNLIAGEIKLTVFAFIFAAISFGFFAAYHKGESNIQKFLFGALVMFLIVDIVEVLFVYISLIDVVGVIFTIISAVVLLLLIVLLISHILQQSDRIRHSDSFVIGQCCGLLMILWVVFMIVTIIKGIISPSDITFVLSFVFTCMMLICVETRVAKYKKIRATLISQNNWNEETKKETKKLFSL